MPGKAKGISSSQFLSSPIFLLLCCLPSNHELLTNFELLWVYSPSGSQPLAIGEPVHPRSWLLGSCPLVVLPFRGPGTWGPGLLGSPPFGVLGLRGRCPSGYRSFGGLALRGPCPLGSWHLQGSALRGTWPVPIQVLCGPGPLGSQPFQIQVL